MSERWKNSGLINMLLASFFFSLTAALIKYCAALWTSMELVFLRSFIGFLYLLPLLLWRRRSLLGRRTDLLLWRGLFGFLGLALYFYALTRIEIATAILLNSMSPLFLLLLSGRLLGERVTTKHFLLTALALLGVVLIAKPHRGAIDAGVVAGLTSALFSAMAYIMVKKASRSENDTVIVFSFAWVASLLASPFFLYGAWHSGSHWLSAPGSLFGALLAMSVAVTLGQFFMTRAYRLGQASNVGLASYAGVMLAGLFGYLFYEEVPDRSSAAGAMLILVAIALSGRLTAADRR